MSGLLDLAVSALVLPLQVPQVRLGVGPVHAPLRLFMGFGLGRQASLRAVDEDRAGEGEKSTGDADRSRQEVEEAQRHDQAADDRSDPGPAAEAGTRFELAPELSLFVAERLDAPF